VITDASCLIVLDTINHLNLLARLFDIVIATPEIADEYGKTLPKWIKLVAVKDRLKQREFASIVDAGEASAIALASEVEADYVVIDDLQGRKLATKLGLKVIGTLGILLKAKQAGLVPLLKPILEQIKQTDFRVTTTLMDAILKEAGE
jgi:predicted nucleic acid-binding protein